MNSLDKLTALLESLSRNTTQEMNPLTETVPIKIEEKYDIDREVSNEKCETPESRQILEQASLQSLGVSYVYIADNSQVTDAVANLLRLKTVLGLDIETYKLSEFAEDGQAGLDPRKSGIRLVQLYDGSNTVYVFDVLKLGGIDAMGEEIWRKPMVAHNAVFELKHLMYAGVIPQKLGCTLLADRVLTGQRTELKESLGLSRRATLKDLSKEMLNLEVSKEQQVSNWADETLSAEQLEYAALDAVLVAKLFPRQQDALNKNNLLRSYQLLRDAQRPIVQMELCGICFDVQKHKALIEEWKLESETLKRDILDTLGKELNLNSGKQLNEWLNEALKQEDLEEWSKTAGGQLSTSTTTFKLHEHMHDMFPKLVQYRHVAKRISSFGESLYKFIDVSKNRLYGSFSLGTTATGRMSSRAPNMQQMPRTGFRDLFKAQEGYKLIGLDYSQQELRVAAIVTQDKELLQIYEDGGDVHRNTAAALLKIPKDQVGKEQRQLAKAVAFGLLYGQGAKGLAAYSKRTYGVEMTEDEAEKHRNAFFRTYRGLRQWQRDTGDRTKILGVVRTQCGRIRDFSRETKGYRYNAALNLPIQGAAAEITLHALIRISPFLCEECRLVNVIHDEILLEVVESRVEELSSKVKEAMEQAFIDVFPESNPYLKGLVEAKIGKNWAEAK